MMIALFFSVLSFGQNHTLEDVGRNALMSSGTIVEHNVIKGYFYFYFSEKISRKMNNYQIVLLDDNLKEIASETIEESKHTNLIESSYNGTSVLFKFYNTKERTIFYRVMDQSGEISDREFRESNKVEGTTYLASITGSIRNINVSAVSENRFVDVYPYKGKKYAYMATCLDNKGKEIWTYVAPEEKGINQASYLTGDENQIILLNSFVKNAMSRDYHFSLVSLDPDGDLNYKMPLEDSKYTLLPHNAFINSNTGEVTVLGEYFDADDKAAKAESKGIFVQIVDEEGEVISDKFFSWSRDIAAKLNAEDKKMAKRFSVYFHDVQMLASGKIVIVGEQYRKQVSAGGVALKMLAASAGGSSDVSTLEMRIGNMFVLTLDKDHELDNVDILYKKPRRILLDDNYSLVSRHLLAKMMDAAGMFDYSFTQASEDRKLISIGYTDSEKEKGKLFRQAKFHLVNFSDGEEEPVKDKIDMETESTAMRIRPAKSGHILISEYFKKQKTIELRLEPINF